MPGAVVLKVLMLQNSCEPVAGDTIGDPFKDTSRPSHNILIELMAFESLVFVPFFATHGGFLFKLF